MSEQEGRITIAEITAEMERKTQMYKDAIAAHAPVILRLHELADAWGNGTFTRHRAPRRPHAIVDFNWANCMHEHSGAILELYNPAKDGYDDERWRELQRTLIKEGWNSYHRSVTIAGQHPHIIEQCYTKMVGGNRLNLIVKLIDFREQSGG